MQPDGLTNTIMYNYHAAGLQHTGRGGHASQHKAKQSYMFVRVYLLSLNTVHTRYVHHELVAAGVPKYCHNKHNKLVIYYCDCTHKIYNNLNILDMTNEAMKSHRVIAHVMNEVFRDSPTLKML